MLSANTQRNLRNAEHYFEEHLCTGEYHSEGRRISGQWMGKAAESLGLDGTVEREAFLALCNNRHPGHLGRLTQRTKTTRQTDAGEESNRRVFYDFTFSPPKSVSILALLGGDERILAAHRAAIGVAVRELEPFAATRVRVGGQNDDRATGNIACATFEHDSSRLLDPHLHTHAVVFNVTHDPVEGRWKALQNFRMLQAKKYTENVYYHELAKGLREAGYSIRNLARGDFEVEGVSDDLIQRFSKRHAQIGEAVAALLQVKPELKRLDPMDLREQLATRNRPRKLRDITRPELVRLWQGQVSSGELAALRKLTQGTSKGPKADPGIALEEATRWAEDHLFDRNSVVDEHQIWSEALARARGAPVSIEALKEHTAARGYIRDSNNPSSVTLQRVLDREREIVGVAREGRWDWHRLAWDPPPPDPSLDVEQRFALKRLLASTDLITLFRGAAGTGKSFVLKELVRAMELNTRHVMVLAPQRQQVMDLEKSGLPNTMTVARFLNLTELPRRLAVVVDEAGQIGGEDMLALIRTIQRVEGRLILSGDTRQHGPVQASDALLAIERHSGIRAIELRTIRRQDPSLATTLEEREAIENYRDAVADAADGRMADSFSRVERMGAIVECEPGTKADHLAEEYLRLVEAGQSLVVVSQTWDEVRTVNASVRARLKEQGKLGAVDTTVEILEPVDLTDAQKRDKRFYDDNSVVVMNRSCGGFAAGTRGRLLLADEQGVVLETPSAVVNVPRRQLGKLSVYRKGTVPVAVSERLQLKANRKLAAGGQANNGELVTVESVEADGSIRLQDGRVLDPGYREFLPGYAVTSYGSQGKTVQYVLISDSGNKAATSAQQWYVSISRGRKGVRIFTTDKAQLRENILQTGSRPLAIDRDKPFAYPYPESPKWRALLPYLRRFGPLVVHRLRLIGFATPQFEKRFYEQRNQRVLGV